jgi:diguanylate cyclase (GGDEF)-like protein
MNALPAALGSCSIFPYNKESTTMRILIAEDSPTTALALRKILELLGHQAAVARDGEEAWQALCAKPVPVVIADWVMPRLDGVELCRRIRERDLSRYVYVILLTVKRARDDRLLGLRAGADDFLVKPVDECELAARLGIAQRLLAMQDELMRANARLAELATTDDLTGLKNRRCLREALDHHFRLAQRQGHPLALAILDVDHFKPYNDAYGHPAGDEALRAVARVLRQNVREVDTPARYGGEEFIVLMPGADGPAACKVAERLRMAIAGITPTPRPITASFGVAAISPEITTADLLLDHADQAVYLSKNRGRNRVTLAAVSGTGGLARAAPPAAASRRPRVCSSPQPGGTRPLSPPRLSDIVNRSALNLTRFRFDLIRTNPPILSPGVCDA